MIRDPIEQGNKPIHRYGSSVSEVCQCQNTVCSMNNCQCNVIIELELVCLALTETSVIQSHLDTTKCAPVPPEWIHCNSHADKMIRLVAALLLSYVKNFLCVSSCWQGRTLHVKSSPFNCPRPVVE